MLKPTEKIWHNGRLIDWNDATIHVLAHVTSYGSSVFEGIRCYATPSGPAIFRVREHIRRLLDSAKIYRMEVNHTTDELADAMSRTGARQQAGLLLFPAPGAARLWRRRRSAFRESRGNLHRLLGMGQVSGRRSARRRRGRLRLQLDPHRAQYSARARQSRRELHELAAHPHGGAFERLRRRASHSMLPAT